MIRDSFLRYFRKPYGPPDPRSPKIPPATKKKKIQKTRKPRLSPKVNARSPKVNARSLKVNVKYFQGIFEELKVFEISCWGVTVTGETANDSRFCSPALALTRVFGEGAGNSLYNAPGKEVSKTDAAFRLTVVRRLFQGEYA